MKVRLRPIEIVVWGGLALTIAGIAASYLWSTLQTERSSLPVYGQVSDFALTNQLGQPFSLNDLAGKIWISDIIFTRCMGPCPKLSRQMEALDKELADVASLRLVSLTADPAFDNPEVLRRYGLKFGAKSDRWNFLTGTKADLYELAAKGLKLAVLEKDEGERENVNDLFIHSTVLTLVDQRGQLRGFFEGLEPGATERIAEAVRMLSEEEN